MLILVIVLTGFVERREYRVDLLTLRVLNASARRFLTDIVDKVCDELGVASD
jgi:hypothetical protein